MNFITFVIVEIKIIKKQNKSGEATMVVDKSQETDFLLKINLMQVKSNEI